MPASPELNNAFAAAVTFSPDTFDRGAGGLAVTGLPPAFHAVSAGKIKVAI